MKTSIKDKKSLLVTKQKSNTESNDLESISLKNQLKTAISADELKKRTTEFLVSLDWKR